MRRSSRKPAKPMPPGPASDWRDKTTEELAAEQGIKLPQDKQALLGAGADLWDSDEEFEAFLKGIYERRRAPVRPAGRPAAK